jgi:hypothetical protein
MNSKGPSATGAEWTGYPSDSAERRQGPTHRDETKAWAQSIALKRPKLSKETKTMEAHLISTNPSQIGAHPLGAQPTNDSPAPAEEARRPTEGTEKPVHAQDLRLPRVVTSA